VLRDGVAAGQVTSAAWGETVGSSVGLAYIRDPHGGVVTTEFTGSGSYQVNVGGELFPATIGLRPPYDPDGTKIKG
jgi:glycine cleavage system aminomethyltransferase T